MLLNPGSGFTVKHHSTEENHSASVALLIAHAGAKDCLNWWDDDALTSAGEFVLNRLFPRKWQLISYRLAMQAAQEKHLAAARVVGLEDFTTLFSKISLVELDIVGIEGIVSSPIHSMDEFKARLTALCPRISELDVPRPQDSGLLDVSELASLAIKEVPITDVPVAAFAAGYTRAQVGKPVFPFIRGWGDLKR